MPKQKFDKYELWLGKIQEEARRQGKTLAEYVAGLPAEDRQRIAENESGSALPESEHETLPGGFEVRKPTFGYHA